MTEPETPRTAPLVERLRLKYGQCPNWVVELASEAVDELTRLQTALTLAEQGRETGLNLAQSMTPIDDWHLPLDQLCALALRKHRDREDELDALTEQLSKTLAHRDRVLAELVRAQENEARVREIETLIGSIRHICVKARVSSKVMGAICHEVRYSAALPLPAHTDNAAKGGDSHEPVRLESCAASQAINGGNAVTGDAHPTNAADGGKS